MYLLFVQGKTGVLCDFSDRRSIPGSTLGETLRDPNHANETVVTAQPKRSRIKDVSSSASAQMEKKSTERST